MAPLRAALLGALVVCSSALLHNRLAEDDVEDLEAVAEDAEAVANDAEALTDDSEAAPPAGRGPAKQQKPSLAERHKKHRATLRMLAEKERRNPFEMVSLLLVGTEPDNMDAMEDGYRPFFRDIIHLQWVTDTQMESLQEEAAGRHPVILNQRSEDTDVTVGIGPDQDVTLSGDVGDTHTASLAAQVVKPDAPISADEAAALESHVGAEGALPPPVFVHIEDVAGPLERAGGHIVFACLRKKRQSYAAACLGEVLKHSAKAHPESIGLFVSNAEFWFGPMSLAAGPTGFRAGDVWQLGEGLISKDDTQKQGTKCWSRFADIQKESSWRWGSEFKDSSWTAAVHAFEALDYKKHASDARPQACIGWPDAYFLPKKQWEAVGKMLPHFKGVQTAAAVPTILNYLTRFGGVQKRVEDRCWGGCCSPRVSDPKILAARICGQRVDVGDEVMGRSWSDLMFNESMRMRMPGEAQILLTERYSSRGASENI